MGGKSQAGAGKAASSTTLWQEAMLGCLKGNINILLRVCSLRSGLPLTILKSWRSSASVLLGNTLQEGPTQIKPSSESYSNCTDKQGKRLAPKSHTGPKRQIIPHLLYSHSELHAALSISITSTDQWRNQKVLLTN